MWGSGGGSSAVGSGNGNPYGQNGPGFSSGGEWSGGGSGNNYAGYAGALGAIGSGIAGAFANNPFDAGKGYYDDIPGMLEKYYSPYIQNGQQAADNMQYYMDMGKQAGGTLSSQLNGLVNDPTAKMSEWGANFQQSPGYQFQVDQALGAANRASAAGGMAGSPMEQQQIAGTVNQLANQDYYNYINHAGSMYTQGMAGLQNMYNMGGQMGQNMYGISAEMSKSLAENMGSAYMNQGNMASAGANYDNQKGGGMGGTIGSGLGMAVGTYFGGPLGGMAGSAIGGKIGGMF